MHLISSADYLNLTVREADLTVYSSLHIQEQHITIITKTRPCIILQFFTAVKQDNFQMKNCDVFLIFAQNIDCGYTLEPPQ